jgi:hypothetical protein
MDPGPFVQNHLAVKRLRDHTNGPANVGRLGLRSSGPLLAVS